MGRSWDRQTACGFDVGTTQAAVEFDVRREGELLGATASNRPRMVSKSFMKLLGPESLGSTRGLDRFRVPTGAEVTWCRAALKSRILAVRPPYRLN
jgi:hypothetical protein